MNAHVTRAPRIGSRIIAVTATLACRTAAPVILTTAPHAAAVTVLEIPLILGMVAAAANIRRHLR